MEMEKEMDNGDGTNRTGDTNDDSTGRGASTPNGDSKDEVTSSSPVEDVAPAPAPANILTTPDSNSSSAPRGRITRDWTLQLLFDSLYLDEALHRKRSRGTAVTSLVGKVDSLISSKVGHPSLFHLNNHHFPHRNY